MLHLDDPLSIKTNHRTPPANTELENCHSHMVLRQPTGQFQVIGLSRTHPQYQVQMPAPSILLLASADLIPLPTVILKGSQPPPSAPIAITTHEKLQYHAITGEFSHLHEAIAGHYVTVKGVSYSLGHDHQPLHCCRSHHWGVSHPHEAITGHCVTVKGVSYSLGHDN